MEGKNGRLGGAVPLTSFQSVGLTLFDWASLFSVNELPRICS